MAKKNKLVVENWAITEARKLNQKTRFQINPSNGYITDKGEIFCKVRECYEKEESTQIICETLNAVNNNGFNIINCINTLVESNINYDELAELIEVFEQMKVIKTSLKVLTDLNDNILCKHDDNSIEYTEDTDINDFIFSIRMRSAEIEPLLRNLSAIFEDFTVIEEKQTKKK